MNLKTSRRGHGSELMPSVCDHQRQPLTWHTQESATQCSSRGRQSPRAVCSAARCRAGGVRQQLHGIRPEWTGRVVAGGAVCGTRGGALYLLCPLSVVPLPARALSEAYTLRRRCPAAAVAPVSGMGWRREQGGEGDTAEGVVSSGSTTSRSHGSKVVPAIVPESFYFWSQNRPRALGVCGSGGAPPGS